MKHLLSNTFFIFKVGRSYLTNPSVGVVQCAVCRKNDVNEQWSAAKRKTGLGKVEMITGFSFLDTYLDEFSDKRSKRFNPKKYL